MAQIKNVAQGAYVTVIDPSDAPKSKLRVAAYARVSSDSADQLNSYLAQVDYYTRFISSREDWELVDVYADEGLTGMETRKRDDFNRMIADCRDGKIDRILVKSVSRFARNQEDYIYYMRELLRLGVTISFEKENLDTGKMNSEQVADIYGAFAQIETTGHSANMRISNRIRMEKGIFVPAKAPYGYRLIQNNLVIVPEEAEVVRRIYQMFLSGQGIFDIANELNQEGVQHTNGTGKWYQYAINYILTNVTFSARSVRRMRDFYHTYENEPAVMRAAMEIGWTQNVVILEAGLTLAEKAWYIRAVRQFGWSKLALIEQIDRRVHEQIDLDTEEKACYTGSVERVEEANDENPLCVPWEYLSEPNGRVRDEGYGGEGGTQQGNPRRVGGDDHRGDRQPGLSSCTEEARRTRDRLRGQGSAVDALSRLRAVRPDHRHGSGEPRGYAPYLPRRPQRQDTPPDGIYRPSRRRRRPVVHTGFRGDVA